MSTATTVILDARTATVVGCFQNVVRFFAVVNISYQLLNRACKIIENDIKLNQKKTLEIYACCKEKK